MTQKKRILVIPHASATNVKVRSMEVARHLSERYDVYYLTWGTIEKESLFAKGSFVIKELLKRRRVWNDGAITFVNVSRLYRPFGLARIYNKMILQKVIKDFDIDVVINASGWAFSLHQQKEVFYIYDLVDDHVADVQNSPAYKKVVDSHIKEEIKKSDVTIACSHQLVNLLNKRYSQDAMYIPNGTDINEFEEVTESDIQKIREQYGLDNKFIIGYIGNHGYHSGLRFLIDVFLELKKTMTDALLFVVGPGSEVDALKNEINYEDIIFTGPISPNQIPAYFKTIDIGVLPFLKIPFTDKALPIKILEYTASKKIVISTPLDEVISLNFPNIYFANQNVKEWIKAIEKARSSTWNEWNTANLEYYDWKNIVNRLDSLINK
jgi:glycosyltransferase involved in cell wall biosynthesis